MVRPSLTLVRRIRAPPARVFAAFLRPDQVIQWWGPQAGPALHADMDVRPGGGFRIGFRTEDGEEHETIGAYQTIEPDRRLVFSMHWVTQPERVSRVTLDFVAIDEGTELTVLHEQLHDEAVLASVTIGWGATLDKLQGLLESTPETTA